MFKLRSLLLALCLLAAVARPVGAQEDPPAPPTSAPATTTPPATTTTTSTTVPSGPPSSAPEDTTTTTTVVIDEGDPVGHVDAPPPEEVPISDVTIPDAPRGASVGGANAGRLIRRELRVAQAEAVEAARSVDEAARAVDELADRLASTQRDLATLDVAQQLAVERLEVAEAKFRERIANAVVRGNASSLETVIGAGDINQVETGKVMLRAVAEADSAAVAEYVAAKNVVDDAVVAAVEDVGRTRRELRDARARLREALAVNAERRFQLAVFSAGSEIVIEGFVFPVGEPYEFIDSWGFPRMTGTEYSHGHQGVDIMAPFGTPLFATERGVVIRVGSDVLGGTKLWLKGQSGTYYYYAHLQSYAEGVVEGTPVEAGDVVGFVGDTGNAQGGAPHLHFQLHPGGGDPVNPYGLLKVVSDLSRR